MIKLYKVILIIHNKRHNLYIIKLTKLNKHYNLNMIKPNKLYNLNIIWQIIQYNLITRILVVLIFQIINNNKLDINNLTKEDFNLIKIKNKNKNNN